MRKIIGLVLAMVFVSSTAFAARQNNFVVNIIKDNQPVREIEGKVAMPFDSEYAIRLKNIGSKRCIAKVFIDGALASDNEFVLNANDFLDLERFVIGSLTEGKKFQFVSLNNSKVDDPTRAENGIVRVEFKKEKKSVSHGYMLIIPKEGYIPGDYNFILTPGNGDYIITPNTSIFTTGDSTLNMTTDCNVGMGTNPDQLLFVGNAGATIPGSMSTQKFYEVEFDAEDEVTVIELKIVGL